MIYKFDTDNKKRAIAALVIYAVYRSRDQKRFKVSTKMWEQITNFCKLSAKKSTNLAEFIEHLRKPMHCEAIKPAYCEIEGTKGATKQLADGTVFESGADSRQFLTRILEECSQEQVISTIINETAFIIMLVRERLETEKHTQKMESQA